MRKIAILLVSLAALVLSLTGCGEGQPVLQIDRAAPNFKLKNLSGETVSLSSLQGRLVLINVWAISCPSCVAEMPYFAELHKDWQSRTDVYLLNINLGESASEVKAFLDSRHFLLNVLLDTDNEFGQMYSVRYTPTTIVIDSQGKLRKVVVGPFQNKAAIVNLVTPYL